MSGNGLPRRCSKIGEGYSTVSPGFYYPSGNDLSPEDPFGYVDIKAHLTTVHDTPTYYA
jgi:hypothetical protein